MSTTLHFRRRSTVTEATGLSYVLSVACSTNGTALAAVCSSRQLILDHNGVFAFMQGNSANQALRNEVEELKAKLAKLQSASGAKL